MFDRASMRFELFGELQTFAKMLGRLVDCESRTVGCDLKQDPAGLAKINGVKILAIDYRRDGETQIDKFLTPGELLLVIRRTKSDVMHRAGRDMPDRIVRSFD